MTIGMLRKKGMLTAVSVALAALAGTAAGQDIAMKEQAGVRWACGGAGVEERAALASLRSQANLELLFVTARRGGYLADVAVSIYAPKAASPLLEFTAEGPMCMIFAPAGAYRIEASFKDAKRVQQASAGAAGKPARAVFSFPGEPWDGVWASEEEKRQAKTD
jgi:hypothetical protein